MAGWAEPDTHERGTCESTRVSSVDSRCLGSMILVAVPSTSYYTGSYARLYVHGASARTSEPLGLGLAARTCT
eukprot:3801807-Prymnesium_polylepis.1